MPYYEPNGALMLLLIYLVLTWTPGFYPKHNFQVYYITSLMKKKIQWLNITMEGGLNSLGLHLCSDFNLSTYILSPGSTLLPGYLCTAK